MPKAGDVVAGKYLIARVLGEGGMGIVYEATHQRLRQRVALKMLLPAMLEHEVLVSRFEREARAAAQLRGRHVARVVDVDVTPDGLPYMVMDFLEGHDLQVEIDARGRIDVPEAVDWVLQACAAMVEAHQIGIIHRDLKPSNLFLAREGDLGTRIVKVLDFGISKIATDGEAKLTDAHTVMGTALYMSPEQVLASHAVDARTDIWALGVILYEALSGRVPWLGPAQQVAAAIVTTDPPDLCSLSPALPAELAAIVHTALRRDPDARFPDVRQLSAALAPFARAGSVGRSLVEAAFPPGSSPRVPTIPTVSSAPSEPMPSVPPSDASMVARTVLHARGVSPSVDVTMPIAVLPPESLGRPGVGPSQSPRSAIFLGILVGLLVVAASIGGVSLLASRARARAKLPPEPALSVMSAVATAPAGDLASAPPKEVEALPPSSSVAPPPLPTTPRPKPSIAVGRAAPVPAAPPSAKPTSSAVKQAPSSGLDKPLFL
jgi:serine/threonine-protein kinase